MKAGLPPFEEVPDVVCQRRKATSASEPRRGAHAHARPRWTPMKSQQVVGRPGQEPPPRQRSVLAR